MTEAFKRGIAKAVAARLEGITTVYVYGQATTIDRKGIARDPDGNVVCELDPEDYQNKSKQEITDRLKTIFFYDQP